ncbi:MAG: phage tail sheath family protein, partial [Planctomycetota bacterium]|nr:phage tail sheath family protein [Planctomycetota bacterium]
MTATTGFFHGVRTNQVPTAIVPPREIMSALPIVFGCAPIHRLSAEAQAAVMPGKMVMVYGLPEAGVRLGIDVQRDDFENWTLSETAYSYFYLHSVAPVIFVNLFDPAKHKKSITSETVAFTGAKGRLAHADLVDQPILTPAGGGDPYVAGIDYVANTITGEITILDDGAMATVDQASAAY